MKTDAVSSAVPAVKGAGQAEKPLQDKGGEAFGSLLQEIFSTRMSQLQSGNTQDKVSVQLEQGMEEPVETFPQESTFISSEETSSEETGAQPIASSPSEGNASPQIPAEETEEQAVLFPVEGNPALLITSEETVEQAVLLPDEGNLSPQIPSETVENLPAPQDQNKELTDSSGGYKKELMERLLKEIGEEGENILVLLPWLLYALSADEATTEKGSSEGTGLPELSGEFSSGEEVEGEKIVKKDSVQEMQLEKLFQLLGEILSGLGEEKEILPADFDFSKMMADNIILKPDELLLMEKKLVSGEIPLLDEKGFLTPQAGSVISSYLNEEEMMEKLKLFFPELDGKMEAELVQQPVGNEEKNPGENFIFALQNFLEDFLGVEKQLPSGETSLPGEKFLLNPEANVEIVFSLQEGRVLEKPTTGESVKPGEYSDSEQLFYAQPQTEAPQEKQPATFLERLESFLRSFLLGESGPSGEKTSAAGLGQGSTGDSSREAEIVGKPGSGGEFVFPSGIQPEEAASIHQTTYRDNLVQPREIVNQIIDKITLLTRSGEQELRMKLQPEFLGEIMIRMRRVKGVLTAEITTQNIAVKELLEGQMDTLRQRFQQMDMNVEEFRILLNNERDGGNGEGAREHYRESEWDRFAAGSAYGKNETLTFEDYEEKRGVNYLA